MQHSHLTTPLCIVFLGPCDACLFLYACSCSDALNVCKATQCHNCAIGYKPLLSYHLDYLPFLADFASSARDLQPLQCAAGCTMQASLAPGHHCTTTIKTSVNNTSLHASAPQSQSSEHCNRCSQAALIVAFMVSDLLCLKYRLWLPTGFCQAKDKPQAISGILQRQARSSLTSLLADTSLV